MKTQICLIISRLSTNAQINTPKLTLSRRKLVILKESLFLTLVWFLYLQLFAGNALNAGPLQQLLMMDVTASDHAEITATAAHHPFMMKKEYIVLDIAAAKSLGNSSAYTYGCLTDSTLYSLFNI